MKSVIVRDLIDRLTQRQVAAFLADSYTQGEASEQALASELATHCGYEEPNQELTRVADYFEVMYGRQGLVQRTIAWVKRTRSKPTPLQLSIAALPFSVIVTTSIDTRLEEALQRAGRPFTKVVRDSDTSFGDSKQTMLFKVSGCVEQPETLVLTTRDQRLTQRMRPLIANQLKVIYGSKTIVFLNYDLQRDYLRQLHDETMAENRTLHCTAYAITPSADEFTRRYWAKDNIVVVTETAEVFLQAAIAALPESTPATSPRGFAKVTEPAMPFKYLDHFDTADENLFFGRSEEVNSLSRRILAGRQLVIFGRSGFGKTSLIKAGLMPEFVRLGYLPIYSRCLDEPLTAIERAIGDAVLVQTGTVIDSEDSSENRLLSVLVRAYQTANRPLVLFVDQLEELFRLPYEQQQALIAQVARVITNEFVNFRIVLALRDDFFPELEGWQNRVPSIYHHFFRVGRLTERGAAEAIAGPLRFFEVAFEDKLVEMLIDDLRAEGSVEPAQLQIVCSRLYERFAAEQIITVEHYAQLGGVQAIFRAYLDEVLARLTVPRRALARRILQELVSTNRTKLLRTAEELAVGLRLSIVQLEQVLADLERSRLLRRLEAEDEYKYELIHDHIVQQVWEALSDDEVQVKQVREMVRFETNTWPRYRTPLGLAKLEAVYRFWDRLQLDERELELVFRSSLAFGRLRQWTEATAELTPRLYPVYVRLLEDESREVVRFAALLLSTTVTGDKLGAALIKVRDVHQYEVRRTLHQLQQGRSFTDFTAEVDDAGWRERSRWSISDIIGIDFGTGTSAVAVMEPNGPVIIPNQEGSKFTPSVVAFSESGEVVVGTPALLQAPVNPTRTIFSIKRQLGTNWTITIGNQAYNAVEIAYRIFSYLKGQAEIYLQRPVTQVVLAAPAYFNLLQRQALVEAAKMAGLEVLRLVAEPTAAAMAFGIDRSTEHNVLVYDLGAGTFDVSVLEIDDNVVEVKAINGDSQLGGDDFDARIVRYLLERIAAISGLDLSHDFGVLVRLKEAAEKAKIALSGLETVDIYVPFLYSDTNGVHHLNVSLTRAQFAEMTADLVERTLECSRRAKKDAYWMSDHFEVLLIGLSTKIPHVREAVRDLFNVEPRRGVNPDEAVALGVAIQAGVLNGSVRGFVLLDATPLSLGVETLGGVMKAIIKRNTTIPTQKFEIFSTASDGQTSVEFHLLQGEAESAADCLSLGRLKLDGISPAPKGVPQIEISFDVDGNGILVVEATDKATGKQVSETVTLHMIPTSGDNTGQFKQAFLQEVSAQRNLPVHQPREFKA